MKTVQDFDGAWDRALFAAGIAPGARACARAYVVIVDKADRPIAKRWATAKRRIWTGPSGHMPNAIYVGYDNASGIECGRAEAFADELKKAGIAAYAEAMED